MDASAGESLAGALGLGAGEVVALVGAGGKTTALQLLAEELVAGGRRVIVTTTTAMLRTQMEAVGPLLMLADGGDLGSRLAEALGPGGTVALALRDGERGKVVGLTLADIGRVRALGLADDILVEADGSRGLPFKAFAPHEPQVPPVATTIVDVAGLDALGLPLTDEHVHRAALLAALVHVPTGSEMTGAVLTAGLQAQVGRLRRTCPAGRVVVFLNEAETPAAQAAGLEIAQELLGPGGAVAEEYERRPDRVVVGSLRQRHFVAVTEAA